MTLDDYIGQLNKKQRIIKSYIHNTRKVMDNYSSPTGNLAKHCNEKFTAYGNFMKYNT